jgi:type II secretory pathway pseudopilin PulG
MKHTNKNQLNNESGFSLLELVFSMIIFLVITAAVFSLLQLGRTDESRTNQQVDSLKNARVSTYLIGRDLMNAGLGYHKTGAFVPVTFLNKILDVDKDITGKRDVLTSISVGNNITPNTIDPTRKNDVISLIYRNLNFNGGTPIRVINETSGDPNSVTLETSPGGTAGVSVFDVFIAEGTTTQLLIIVTGVDPGNNKLTFAFGDPLGLNQRRTGGTNKFYNSLLRKCAETILGQDPDENCTIYSSDLDSTLRLKKVIWMSYKVDANGTLNRIVYGNNAGAPAAEQIQTQPLINNIKSMQFEYAMKNGTISNDPAAGADQTRGTIDDDQRNMNLIRQVTLNLEIEGYKKDEQTGKKQVLKLTSAFSARNLQYDDV